MRSFCYSVTVLRSISVKVAPGRIEFTVGLDRKRAAARGTHLTRDRIPALGVLVRDHGDRARERERFRKDPADALASPRDDGDAPRDRRGRDCVKRNRVHGHSGGFRHRRQSFRGIPRAPPQLEP
jgi:hypothetical protein